MKPLYEEDFYSWVLQQVQIIKDKRYQELDFENLIEEVESFGNCSETVGRVAH